jgi:hypothetical protein
MQIWQISTDFFSSKTVIFTRIQAKINFTYSDTYLNPHHQRSVFLSALIRSIVPSAFMYCPKS